MSGVGYYGFGVLLKHIQEEFGWGRGITSTAFLTFCLIVALFSPLIGKLTDRYGAKIIIVVGGFLLGSGFTLLSMTVNLLQFYVTYGIVGLGCLGCGLVPVSSLVSEWFFQERGTALGFVASGMGTGGLFLPLIIGNFLIPSFGWRTAYRILGLLTILLVEIVALTLIKMPYEEGKLCSNNAKHAKISLINSSREGILKGALKRSTFWLIACAYILFEIAECGTIQHLIVHLVDVGFPEVEATSVLSAVSLFSVVGRFIFGYISDRLMVKFCAAISFCLGLVATTLLIAIKPASNLMLICLFVLTMGLTVGSWAPVTSMLISIYFGTRCYATFYGTFMLFFFTSSGLGPTFFGYVYDIFRNYNLAYILSLIFYSIAITFIAALKRPVRLSKRYKRVPR
jgi:MFS family permease